MVSICNMSIHLGNIFFFDHYNLLTDATEHKKYDPIQRVFVYVLVTFQLYELLFKQINQTQGRVFHPIPKHWEVG